MAQRRMLGKEICESDSFASLNDSSAQLLCCLLTPWWDDHGKMIGDEVWIKGNIVRKLKKFTEKEISRCLRLINDGLDVQWWVDEGGNKWLYWSKFDSHQTISDDKKHKDTLPSPKIPKNPQKSPSIREDKISIREEEEKRKVVYVDFEKSTLDAWNSFCKSFPILSQIKEISDKRRVNLKKRFERESFRDFNKILEAIKTQPFLLGKNKREWKVGFDWLIKNDTNYLKVLENSYKDNASASPFADVKRRE